MGQRSWSYKHIARDLEEKLPPELHEGILKDLRLNDILALLCCEKPILSRSILSSPAWKGILRDLGPDDLQSLMDLWRLLHPDSSSCKEVLVAIRPETLDHADLDWFCVGSLFPWKHLHGELSLLRRLESEMFGNWVELIFNIESWEMEYLSEVMTEQDLCAIFPLYPVQWPGARDIDSPGRKFIHIMSYWCHCGHTDHAWCWGCGDRRCPLQFPMCLRQMERFLKWYEAAQCRLNTLMSKQLSDLAKLYERHPTRLKAPLAPQAPRSNIEHISARLQIASKRVLNNVFLGTTYHHHASVLRHRHAGLVPYDWCLRLWQLVAEDDLSLSPPVMASAPANVRKSMELAVKGLKWFYEGGAAEEESRAPATGDGSSASEGEQKETPPMPRITARGVQSEHRWYFVHGEGRSTRFGPADLRELEWLEAFVICIEWMEQEFPDFLHQALTERDQEWEFFLQWKYFIRTLGTFDHKAHEARKRRRLQREIRRKFYPNFSYD